MDNSSEKHPKKLFFLSLLLIILVAVLAVLAYLFFRQTVFKNESVSYTQVSPVPTASRSLSIGNSYLFASPIRAKVGVEVIRVTVFALDNRGVGISGQNVNLGQASGLSVPYTSGTTDENGMVYFDVQASQAGAYLLHPTIAGQEMTNFLTITFEE